MPIPSQARIERSTAREQVYDRLRGWIVNGTLKPLELIKDTQLAQQLGVSRTPVREALQRLADEGLIETVSSRYTRVAALDPAAADELYGLIQRLERYALELAAPHLTETEFATLEFHNLELAAALERHDTSAALEADNHLHNVLIERSGSRELERILNDLKTRLQRLEFAHFDSLDAMASVGEHTRMIAELRTHHLKNATRALESNWEGATHRFSRRVTRNS